MCVDRGTGCARIHGRMGTFLAMKEAKGDPHKSIITLSSLFATPSQPACHSTGRT
jgi:hypothetical protein